MSLRERMWALGFRSTMSAAAYDTFASERGKVVVEWRPKPPFHVSGPRPRGWHLVWYFGELVWSADRMMDDDLLLALLLEEERACT